MNPSIENVCEVITIFEGLTYKWIMQVLMTLGHFLNIYLVRDIPFLVFLFNLISKIKNVRTLKNVFLQNKSQVKSIRGS